MIEAKAIKKAFGKLEVLKGIDLFIPKGTFSCIVGESGAGKTTLLQILGTLDTPNEGEIRIDGENITQYKNIKLSKFRNQKIGFVFQFHHLLPEFTALENVCIPGWISNRSKSDVYTKAKELLSYLGLSDRFLHKPGQLSGGEQQRVAVARALINNPLVVFADEPTGNLDSRNANELHQLLFEIRKDFGTTFVIVTHNEKLAQQAELVLQMKDGLLLNSVLKNEVN